MIGIYKITNKVNGKVYIGQSWDINKRWIQHTCHRHNTHLNAAFNKYGIAKFDFEVIREFGDNPLTKLFLDSYEKKYIADYNSTNPKYGYNKKDGGANGRPSDETKNKLSKSCKGRIPWNKGKPTPKETIEKINNAKKGYKTSQETKNKISNSCRGLKRTQETKERIGRAQKGKVYSEATRRKIAAAHIGLKQSIYTKAKRACTKLGYASTFDLEPQGTKVYVG